MVRDTTSEGTPPRSNTTGGKRHHYNSSTSLESPRKALLVHQGTRLPISIAKESNFAGVSRYFLFRSVTDTINRQRPEVVPVPTLPAEYTHQKSKQISTSPLKIILVKSRRFSTSGSASFPSTTFVRYLPF